MKKVTKKERNRKFGGSNKVRRKKFAGPKDVYKRKKVKLNDFELKEK